MHHILLELLYRGLLDNSSLTLSKSKSGIDPSNRVDLAKHVKLSCPNLVFSGLMTIGRPDYTSTPENFKTLSNCRTEVCKPLEMPEEQCELSMGMSFYLTRPDSVDVSQGFFPSLKLCLFTSIERKNTKLYLVYEI
nr:pyridoxal phosphate homeostasis protein isoform X1 [Arachis hypogaea]